MSAILVVGSVAYDTISTPHGRKENILGGSANYFSLAASLYSRVNVVGIVGDDYHSEDLSLLSDRNIDLHGLQKVPGSTFHWEGRYEEDMNEAITIDTQLNVFESFDPQLPEAYQSSEYVFLANIDPVLQSHVLQQIRSPKLVGMDTMNFWIDSKLSELKDVLAKVDVLLLNETEARKLAGTWNTVQAARILSEMGPKAVVIKRGEYGFMTYSQGDYFVLPAFPVSTVQDPTGAGDTFAAGFFGYLSTTGKGFDIEEIKRACVHGCLLASFTVEDFGLERLKNLSWADVEKRQALYRKVISYI